MTERAQDEPTRTVRTAIGEAAKLVRPMAVLALFAMLLAQSVAPALKGTGLGLGKVIDAIDLVASVSSHMLALATSALCIGLLLIVGRDSRVSLVSRVMLVAQTTIVLVLAVPASRFRLSPFACFFLGIVACSAALSGSIEGLKEPRSRAAGLVLLLMGFAAASRVVSAALIVIPSLEQAERFTPLSTLLATVSVAIHGLAILVALAWFASRNRRTVSMGTLFALAASMLLAWAFLRADQPNPSTWIVFLGRMVDQLTPLPTSLLPKIAEGLVGALGPVVAIVALTTRKQMATVIGAIALTLTAGTVADVPGRALILVLAALAVTLGSRDEYGMWEVITGKKLTGAVRKAGSKE